MMNKKIKTIIGWVVSILVAIIGTLGVSQISNTATSTSTSTSNQNQSITINIDGQSVEINEDNAQNVYDKIEDDKNNLSSQVETLEEKNQNLSSQLARYKEYGTAALVSKNKNYDANKVSLLAFEPVNQDDWHPNEGTLKDSLGNTYTVNLDYLILNQGDYGEYYTNEKFSKLQFKLVPHETMRQDSAAVIKVFADDLLVFTSDEMTRKSEAETYTVDINNSKFIKIVCESIHGYDPNVLILDSTLIK